MKILVIEVWIEKREGRIIRNHRYERNCSRKRTDGNRGRWWLASGLIWDLAFFPRYPGFPELLQIKFNSLDQMIIKLYGINKLQLIGAWIPARNKKLKIVILNLAHGDLPGFRILKIFKKSFHHKEVAFSWFFRIALLLQLLCVKLKIGTGHPILCLKPWWDGMPPFWAAFFLSLIINKIDPGLPAIRGQNHLQMQFIDLCHGSQFYIKVSYLEANVKFWQSKWLTRFEQNFRLYC